MKRFISMMLAIAMVFGVLPVGEMVAFAADEKPIVNRVEVSKTYETLEDLGKLRVLIEGENLNNLKVQVMKGGDLSDITKATASNEFVAQYYLDAAEAGGRIYIQGKPYSLEDDIMPRITSKEPSNGTIDINKPIKLKGSNVKVLTEKENGKLKVKAKFTEGTNPISINQEDDGDIKGNDNDGYYIEKTWGTELGIFDLVFERSIPAIDGKAPIDIKHEYKKIVNVQGELEVSEDIYMFPTQGSRESEVTLEAETLIPNLSIFLLKSKSDEYTKENMVINETISYKKGKDEEKDTIKLIIPKTIKDLGPKYVVLTNKVDPNKEISSQVNKYKIIEVPGEKGRIQFFTLIDGQNGVKLDSVQPYESSTKGIDAVLKGERIVSVSDNLYKGGTLKDVNIDVKTKMIANYEGGQYDDKTVKTLTREISLVIGNVATFREGSKFSVDTFDRLNIVVPEVEDIEETTKKDVSVQIKNTIVFTDDKKVEFIEADTLKDGFTFHPKKISPEIKKDGVNPKIITVNSRGQVVDDIVITIEGEKFLRYSYVVGGKKEVKNPVVSIADQENSENWFDQEKASNNIRVLNNNIEIDGEKGRQEGDKIKVTIKGGTEIPPEIISEDGKLVSNIKVTNPLRVESDDEGMGPYAFEEIYFKREVLTEKPRIEEVEPDITGTNKNEEIIITGENFKKDGLRVFVDGDEVEGIKFINDKEIRFNAPSKEKGKYTIMIQNKSGEIVLMKEFIYNDKDSISKILGFNPKKGSNGTSVYMNGEGFKTPSTSVFKIKDELDVRNFIGTTVLFRKSGTNESYVDMNEYNLNGRLIELKEYEDDKDIVEIEGTSQLKLSDYSHSIIFENEKKSGEYYVIYKEVKTGNIVLTGGFKSGGENDSELSKYKYILKNDNRDIKAIGEGSNSKVTTSKTGLSFGDLSLVMKTPYRVENNKIVGNNVKVSDDGKTLEFFVNLKSNDTNKKIQNGMYDVIIMNPDTNKIIAKDKFEYIAEPESKPFITRIDSIEQGSAFGKSLRTIKGIDFREGIRVFVGEKEIPSEDIIYINSKEVRVIIPKYDGVIGTDTDHGRKETVITVLNSDGGNSNRKFIYINPNGNPKIDSISPNFGALTGKTEVTIYEATGKDVERGFSFIEYNPSKEYDELIDLTKEDERNKLGGNNKGEAMKKDPSGEDWEKQLKILPKVYFGGEEAEIIKYDTIGLNATGKKTITVLTPKGQSGKVKVQLENNNTGVSNGVDFEYRAINIGNIVIKPGRGTKIGKNSAEIRPSDIKQKPFVESEINIYKEDKTLKRDEKFQLVRFGNENDLNITNKSIDGSMENAHSDNSGRIVNNQANIKVGNLEVIYKIGSDKNTLNFELKSKVYDSKKEEYENITFELKDLELPEDETAVYLPIDILEEKDNKGKKYNGFELIKVYKTRFTGSDGLNNMDRIVVERGYSPDAKVMENGGYIDLKVPSYYSIGEVEVKVINADGGDAKTKYIYTNPANSPVITDAYREGNSTTDEEIKAKEKVVRVDYKGGVNIHIKGKDFRKPSSIDIGDRVNILGEDILHLPQVTDREDYEELMFTMPAVPEDYVGKRYSFIVTTPFEAGDNYNSATTSSTDGEFKIYVEFTKGETNPKITKVTPNQGASSGGTEVTIEGEDFRKKDPTAGLYGELRVFVGENEVPKNNIRFINSKKLIITTPAHESGKVKIKVENPDGAIAQVEGNNDEYTYVSNPKITKIVDPLNGDIRKETLSIEGGETIKIVGSDFLEGAKVIFSPVIKEASKNPNLSGERIFINGIEYILESGTVGTDVEFIDSNNIKAKTPTGKLDTGGVIVINPDNAATPIYKLDYAIPEITSPQDVSASLINDEYIRINWNKVTDKATEEDGKTVQYEVYAISGNSRELIGSTDSTGFVFRDIEPSTTYKFLVRAVGKYGSSKPLDESMSNEVRTGRRSGPKDNDGELGENTTVDKSGDTANVVIGEDAFKGASEYVIDLTRGNLAGSNKVVISMSAKIVINSSNRKIKIIGKDYGLSFSPNVFENSTMLTNKSNVNAGVKFEVLPVNTNFDLAQNNGDVIIGSKYDLRGRTYVASSSNEIENLNGKMNIILDYDLNMATTRKLQNINLVKYDAYDRRFKKITGNSGYGTSTGDINELGIFTITGSRR